MLVEILWLAGHTVLPPVYQHHHSDQCEFGHNLFSNVSTGSVIFGWCVVFMLQLNVRFRVPTGFEKSAPMSNFRSWLMIIRTWNWTYVLKKSWKSPDFGQFSMKNQVVESEIYSVLFTLSYIRIADVFHLLILNNICLCDMLHLMYHVFLWKLHAWSYLTNRIGAEKVLNFDYVIWVRTLLISVVLDGLRIFYR